MFEMFRKLIANFVEQYNSMKATYETEVARIKATYIEGNSQFVNEIRIAKENFDNGVQTLINSSIEQLKGIIQELNSTLAQMVTSDVSPNVIAELELLKTVNLTQYEVDNFLKKYATNYLATKSMKEIAKSKGLETDNVMCADDFRSLIQNIYDTGVWFFTTYQGKQVSYKNEMVVYGNIYVNKEHTLTTELDEIEKQFKTFLQVEGEK